LLVKLNGPLTRAVELRARVSEKNRPHSSHRSHIVDRIETIVVYLTVATLVNIA